MTRSSANPIAFFVTPHGFGHATRAAAVMAALDDMAPGRPFEVFTDVPAWLFEDTLGRSVGYHPVLTDIGMVQTTSLTEDLGATVKRLDWFLPFDAEQVERLARALSSLGCSAVVCDIAALGIAAAREAGLPSVLVENFTWDFIYRGYGDRDKSLARHVRTLSAWYGAADFRVKTEPCCEPGPAALLTPPVHRVARQGRDRTRSALGVPPGAPLVLVTMGGAPWSYECIDELERRVDSGVWFVVPGGGEEAVRRGRVLLLPRRSEFYHPDLIAASDAVVGKAGYSTTAEVYHAGIPFGYVSRASFPEAPALVRFIDAHMPSLPIHEDDFVSGSWIGDVARLLDLPRAAPSEENGATMIARFIAERFG